MPLGPVLPDWPAGLVVHTVLQGDVIQEAEAEILDRDLGSAFWNADRAMVRELDAIGRFLAVAGRADEAARAQRVRDALLPGVPIEQVAVASGTPLPHHALARARDRRCGAQLESRLAVVEAAVTGRAAAPAARVAVDALPALLVGAEFATTRLIVAALDPDTEPADTRDEVLRG